MKSDGLDAKKQVWGFVSHVVTNSRKVGEWRQVLLNMVE
jgi:hypothetical protein